jgi:hypothetical protein
MSYVLVAVSVFLAAQAPGGDFQPMQRPRRGAPAANLGAPPRQAQPQFQQAAPQQNFAQQQPAQSAAATTEPGFPDLPAADPYAEPTPVQSAPQAAQPPAAAPARQPRSSGSAAVTGPSANEPMQPVDNLPQRLRPPELIAEALENPKQGAVVGTPMTLAQAMVGTSDRNQQLAIAKAYWKLATAQAEYHWSLTQRDLLRDQTRSHTNQAGTLSARAAARADVRSAQLEVDRAQAELAALIPANAQKAAPLAVDRPHVGEYRTNFDEIFGNRPAPGRLRLVNRTLPVRRQAIDAHAEAIVAALDAVEATGEQFRTTGQGLATLLDSIELLKQERRAFIAEVRQYNLEIAEYAFAVAPSGAANQTLVSMLIRTTPPATAQDPGQPADPTQPQLRKTFRRPLEPGDGASLRTSTDSKRVTVRRQLGFPDAQPEESAPAVANLDQTWYATFLEITSQPQRVQKLGNLMHWDRNYSPEVGKPISLSAYLRDVPAPTRLAAIEAFWQAREKAAGLQLLYDQLEQLNALQPLALPRPGQEGLAEAAVRLQAARRSTRAGILDAQAELMTAQARLVEVLGRPVDANWLLPATPPQSGRYVVSIKARRGFAQGTRWAERIALEYDKLQHRGDALMQADAHRMQLLAEINEFGADRSAGERFTMVDKVLWAIHRQNQLGRGFLRDLTEYNMAIANYAILSQPETVSGEQLAAKLAIPRSTIRES